MNLCVFETPQTVKRLAPGVPLLVEFGYQVVAEHEMSDREGMWPPRKVENYSYEVYTRTSAGRSRSSYFMQALTVAILARETGGYFWVNGDAEAVRGDAALKRVLDELNGLDSSAHQLNMLLKDIEANHGNEAAGFKAAMQKHLGVAFDDEAFPFQSWPPTATYTRFAWPEPILAPALLTTHQDQRPKKISTYWVVVNIVVAAMVLLTLIYS